MPAAIDLFLYSHSACCLCDRLEQMLEPHLEAIRQCQPVTLTERNITTNPQWAQLYQYRIPVLTHNDQVILEGRPDADQVARAMALLVE